MPSVYIKKWLYDELLRVCFENNVDPKDAIHQAIEDWIRRKREG